LLLGLAGFGWWRSHRLRLLGRYHTADISAVWSSARGFMYVEPRGAHDACYRVAFRRWSGRLAWRVALPPDARPRAGGGFGLFWDREFIALSPSGRELAVLSTRHDGTAVNSWRDGKARGQVLLRGRRYQYKNQQAIIRDDGRVLVVGGVGARTDLFLIDGARIVSHTRYDVPLPAGVKDTGRRLAPDGSSLVTWYAVSKGQSAAYAFVYAVLAIQHDRIVVTHHPGGPNFATPSAHGLVVDRQRILYGPHGIIPMPAMWPPDEYRSAGGWLALYNYQKNRYRMYHPRTGAQWEIAGDGTSSAFFFPAANGRAFFLAGPGNPRRSPRVRRLLQPLRRIPAVDQAIRRNERRLRFTLALYGPSGREASISYPYVASTNGHLDQPYLLVGDERVNCIPIGCDLSADARHVFLSLCPTGRLNDFEVWVFNR